MSNPVAASRDIQQRALTRARDLAAFRAALIDLAIAGDPLDAARRAIIMPTRASAELLRQSLEARLDPERPSVLLPALITRDAWIARLHDALPGRPPMLSRVEREILLERAARRTADRPRMERPPFHLRPGLIAAMLDFYDELGRRLRTVRRFGRVLFDQLKVERGMDRGSESLIHQTAFLGFAFLAYERAVEESGALDERGLRRQLIERQPVLPFDHVVIAVADHPSDPRGLWPADYDLLGRLHGVSRVDIVVTDETHDAGFRDRIERELPGLEERRRAHPGAAPLIVRPPAQTGVESIAVISRDREEELRDVARAIRDRAVDAGHELRESTAVVFHRPLPYLYLAQQVMADARIPYEAFDALPLGAEPYAAALDLVMTFARTGGTREAAEALLRCTLLRFDVDGEPVGPEDVAALDTALAERRASGEADTYLDEIAGWFGERSTRDRRSREGAVRAARAAADARLALHGYRVAPSASAQVRTLAVFLRRHERGPGDDDLLRDRHLRARAAVLGVLDELAAAYARHDDAAREDDLITAAVRHAIESQMFTPRRGTGGVHLVDAAAARFGGFDHVHLVGLVETDWPERPARNIFYTTGLLKSLGWPQEPDELRAQQAAFRDLLGLAARTTTLHAFELDGDAIVTLSPMVEAARGLPAVEAAPRPRRRIFADEVLAFDGEAGPTPDAIAGLEPATASWLELRRSRPALSDLRYRGYVEPRAPAAYRVSAVDRYVDCPFKYFAETVLGLPEERDEASGLTPLERGTLVHELFERFYKAWDGRGRGTITPETLPEAIALFGDIAREALAGLPAADRALEETRLLGSLVARGVAERVFELECDAGGDIRRRLIEYELRGPFEFPLLHGLAQKTVEIRGKADRIDVFADNTLRVIDYKLSTLPDLDSSVQIAVYAHAARQRLEAAEGRQYSIRAAMYLAFGDDRQLEGRLGGRDQLPEMAVLARASDFAGQIERIEAGEFPPRPRRPGDCQWCRVAGVCRKEYQTDRDEAAESV